MRQPGGDCFSDLPIASNEQQPEFAYLAVYYVKCPFGGFMAQLPSLHVLPVPGLKTISRFM